MKSLQNMMKICRKRNAYRTLVRAMAFLIFVYVALHLYVPKTTKAPTKIAKTSNKSVAVNHKHLKNPTASEEVRPEQSTNFTEKKEKDKVIITWNPFWNWQLWEPYGRERFKSCKHKNCILTRDQNMYNQSDAILCHMVSGSCALPKHRPPHQYWIFFVCESPSNSQSDDKLMHANGMFNITLTYRLSSNITIPNSQRNRIMNLLKNKSHKFHIGETTSIAWIVTKCKVYDTSTYGRLVYFDELSKHFPVGRYGGCPGHISCGKTCYAEAAKKHKFYFAAENSICKDYVTEKPWKAIEVGMIPVVYGYGSYSHLPDHSYINVQDFKSPRLLAMYLKQIGENETLYKEYFKWRENYTQLKPIDPYFCRLCEFLNQPNPPRGTVERLDEFWSRKNDCIEPQIFHESIMQDSKKPINL